MPALAASPRPPSPPWSVRAPRAFRAAAWWGRGALLPAHVVTAETANGRFSFQARDRVIGRLLYVERAYEMEMMAAALGRLRELGRLGAADGRNGTVLDVGAHVGMSAVTLLRQGVFARGVAFEPSPGNFRLLERNIRQNGLAERLTAHRVALSDREGAVALEFNPANFGDNRVRGGENPAPGADGEEGWATGSVPAQTLDGALAAGAGVPPETVRLVWLDIQGHEGAFFRGARGFFTTHPRVPVVAEFWPYGLARAPGGQAGFMAAVAGLFSHFCPWDELAAPPQPIARLASHFGKYGNLFSHMLLLNP